MERKTILVEGMGAPKRVVQQIETRPRTTTICPLCKTRFKKDDPTVLIDLVKRIPLTSDRNNAPERTIRIKICERCAQPVILQKQKAMHDLISLLAEWAVEDVLKETEKKQKRCEPESG